jgi:hypothetical protein
VMTGSTVNPHDNNNDNNNSVKICIDYRYLPCSIFDRRLRAEKGSRATGSMAIRPAHPKPKMDGGGRKGVKKGRGGVAGGGFRALEEKTTGYGPTDAESGRPLHEEAEGRRRGGDFGCRGVVGI